MKNGKLPGSEFRVCISLTVHLPYGSDVPVVLKGGVPGTLSGSAQSQTYFCHNAQTLLKARLKAKAFFTM